ncbi:MAG: biopolymer transporter ExbD [Bacteroidota bacterium]|jgi:biopolymer transport protein ExbD
MSEVNTESSNDKKGGKNKVKKASTRVDFTPMVDLGFLLITFFMLTTSMIKPQTMEINMPSKDPVKETDAPKLKASRAITIILGKDNKVFYYFGTKEGKIDPKVEESNFASKGIRKMLLERNALVVSNMKDLEKERDRTKMADSTFKRKTTEVRKMKDAPYVLIKPTDESSYKNLVDILDEMLICNIASFTIMDITPYDLELIKPKKP